MIATTAALTLALFPQPYDLIPDPAPEQQTTLEARYQTDPVLRAQRAEHVAAEVARSNLRQLKLPAQQAKADAGRQRLAAEIEAKRRAEEEAARRAAEAEAARRAAAAQAAREAERTRVVRPATGRVTSEFGMRTHPISGIYKLHSGTDFAVGDGNAYAAAAGRVSISYPAWAGILVTVDHGGGLVTQYAHLARDTVEPGQWVAAGDRVGLIGARGMATGVHLHWECIVDGEYVDGMQWLRDRGAL